MRARRESGFSAAFPGGTHIIVLLITGWRWARQNRPLLQTFPVPHQKLKGGTVSEMRAFEGHLPGPVVSAKASLHMESL